MRRCGSWGGQARHRCGACCIDPGQAVFGGVAGRVVAVAEHRLQAHHAVVRHAAAAGADGHGGGPAVGAERADDRGDQVLPDLEGTCDDCLSGAGARSRAGCGQVEPESEQGVRRDCAGSGWSRSGGGSAGVLAADLRQPAGARWGTNRRWPWKGDQTSISVHPGVTTRCTLCVEYSTVSRRCAAPVHHAADRRQACRCRAAGAGKGGRRR